MHELMEYIDKRVETAVLERGKAEPYITPGARQEIKAASTRSVAGFRIADEEKEKELLDQQIAAQRAGLDRFILDRRVMRETLDKYGISPLTILPRQAWDNICAATHLFRLNPDKNGRVAITRGCWDGGVAGPFKKPLNKWDEAAFEWAQTQPEVWRSLLYKFWPNGISHGHGRGIYSANDQEVTILLPTPPDDVVEILLKADKAKINMRVAAVAEAIGFRENLAALRDMSVKHYADEDDRIKRLMEEPFIYSEHESATAILAQFGEFPIEKAVVDAIVSSKDFIPDHLSPTSPQYYDNDALSGVTPQQYSRLTAAAAQAQGLAQANAAKGASLSSFNAWGPRG